MKNILKNTFKEMIAGNGDRITIGPGSKLKEGRPDGRPCPCKNNYGCFFPTKGYEKGYTTGCPCKQDHGCFLPLK